MDLTERQLAILNHVVEEAQAWADNAKKEAHVLDKIARHEASYDEAVAKGEYKTRKQRDEAEEKALAKLKKDKYDNAPWDGKRRVAYAKLNQFELISDDAIVGNGTSHRDAVLAIKEKFPKPE